MNENDHQEEDEDENMEKGSQQSGSGYKRKLSERDHGKEEQSKSLNEMHHKQNEPQIR